MPERPEVFEIGTWGVESQFGVQTPTTKRLLVTQFSPSPVVPRTMFRPAGFAVPTSVINTKEHVAAPISGAMAYGDLAYLFSSLLKVAVISTPAGAAAARRHTFSPSAIAPDTFTTYTLEKGTLAGGAERMTGCVVESLTLRWGREDANLSGSIMGQVMQEQITPSTGLTDVAPLPINPNDISIYVGPSFGTSNVQTLTLSVVGGAATGGTFTLTFDNQTTAPIAWNATNAAVQTAIQLLSKAGNNIAVTGGPAPSAAFVFTFSGILAGIDATRITANASLLTGPGAPYANVTAVNTTPGSMIKLLRPDSCELAIPTRYVYGYTLQDSDPSYSYIVQQGIEPVLTLDLEHDPVSAGYMTQLRAGTTYYAKVLARGPFIEPLIPNCLQLLFPFKFTDSPRGDRGGVHAATWQLSLCYDTSFAGFLTATLDTTVQSL